MNLGRKDPRSQEKTHLLEAEQHLFQSLRGEDEYGYGCGDDEDGYANQSYLDGSFSLLDGATSSARTLDTFQGVFAPVSLSMLGSLLFLRMGFIVGNAGLLEALAMFTLGYTIIVATAFSISAIVTNGAVEGGGVYFMISRTLGMEFGGSVGILLWVACLCGSAFTLSACVEGLLGDFGPNGRLAQWLEDDFWSFFLYASILNVANMVICLLGAKWFGYTNVFVLVLVLITTGTISASFFVKQDYSQSFTTTAVEDLIVIDPHELPENETITLNLTTIEVTGTFKGLLGSSYDYMRKMLDANLAPKYEHDCSNNSENLSFSFVFGVMFSGVTGVLTGAGMSGELVNPGKNIPLGTLSGCAFTYIIFVLVTFLTALTCSPTFLLYDCFYMSQFCLSRDILSIGIFMANFSASLSNLIGSSRIIVAVAEDVLFGSILCFVSKGTVNDNPIVAVILGFFFVEIFLLMGSLNEIAQLTTVLCLMGYGAVNLACLGLDLASAPNFRPSFKYYSWHTCLIGFIGSFVMIFLISPLYSTIGLLIGISLVFALNMFSPIRKTNWGSISQALIFHQVRKYLLMLDPRKSHIKFWRPQILLLVKNPRTCCSLIDFVNSLKKGGLYVLGHIYKVELSQAQRDPCVVHQTHWLSLIDHLKIKAFAELTTSPTSLREGIQHLVHISGIGAMKPNTIIMGFFDNTRHKDDFLSTFSAYSTHQFEGIFPQIGKADAEEEADEAATLTKEEYIGTLLDILKMHKNLCICRHFQQLNKSHLFQKPDIAKNIYLDVWLVDFFSPKETDVCDTTSLFLLQLACIVHMVPRWKRLTLRVFSLLKSSDPGQAGIKNQAEIIQHILKLLRIQAQCHVLSWDSVACSSTSTPEAAWGSDPDGSEPIRWQLNTEHLERSSRLVREKSKNAAVIFLYLPLLPERRAEHCFYLDCLEELTNHWPPTMLVNGVSPVTSITL